MTIPEHIVAKAAEAIRADTLRGRWSTSTWRDYAGSATAALTAVWPEIEAHWRHQIGTEQRAEMNSRGSREEDW